MIFCGFQERILWVEFQDDLGSIQRKNPHFNWQPVVDHSLGNAHFSSGDTLHVGQRHFSRFLSTCLESPSSIISSHSMYPIPHINKMARNIFWCLLCVNFVVVFFIYLLFQVIVLVCIVNFPLGILYILTSLRNSLRI